MDKMDEAEAQLIKTAKMLASEGQEMDDDMIYIQKMDLGLFTLQQVHTIHIGGTIRYYHNSVNVKF